MSLDSKEISNIARLAALNLSPDESEKMLTEISDILQYVNILKKVSTTGVQPTSHVHGVVNAFREDIVEVSLNLEQLKLNAPDFTQGGFRVPKII